MKFSAVPVTIWSARSETQKIGVDEPEHPARGDADEQPEVPRARLVRPERAEERPHEDRALQPDVHDAGALGDQAAERREGQGCRVAEHGGAERAPGDDDLQVPDPRARGPVGPERADGGGDERAVAHAALPRPHRHDPERGRGDAQHPRGDRRADRQGRDRDEERDDAERDPEDPEPPGAGVRARTGRRALAPARGAQAVLQRRAHTGAPAADAGGSAGCAGRRLRRR